MKIREVQREWRRQRKHVRYVIAVRAFINPRLHRRFLKDIPGANQ